MSRQNFTPKQRDEIFKWNAADLIHSVSGIMIDERYIRHKEQGLVYFCENCKFCQIDRMYFDIDHLVPDVQLRGTGHRSNIPLNAIVLCKSYETGARGCNQTKGGKLWPPPNAGLARTRPDLDLNYMDIHLRDANTLWP
ncbi:hypothetical protein [Algicella marina]|uniref:Uncharacterized protein n=1 Tax=Algicella marina TaxID=2683284 RepID=A0A6P1SZY0_9RHOB|nr:hypothetical protein [Algicella marina]QHQ35085.1 hypothetical protein GO499_07685 [Algicella marina]